MGRATSFKPRIFWRYTSFRSILLVYFIAIIAIPFFGLGILGPVLYSRKLSEENSSHTSQMLGQVTKNIDYHIEEIDKLNVLISSDDNVKEFFQHGTSAISNDRILLYLENIVKSHPEIAGILLVNRFDQTISNELVRITRDSLLTEKWYTYAVGETQRSHLFPRPLGRNIRTTKPYEAEDVVSVVRAIDIGPPEDPDGVVLIDVKLSVIEDILADTKLGKSGFFFILDEMNEIVYAPTNDIVFRVNPRWFSGVSSSHQLVRQIGGRSYQIISLQSAYTSWKTIGVFPLEEMLKEVIYLRTYSLIVTFVTIVLAVLASFFFSASIARPIVELLHLMNQAEHGDLTVRYHDKGHDEIDRLGEGFNNMLEKIQKLIDLVYLEQKNIREAELKILQAQIKPHFLYNTLDTIHWMAKEHGAKDVEELVTALTRLFRVGLSGGREIITIQEEIEHVQSYLFIQNVRYEGKFDYSIDVEEEILQKGTLKILLQPLVENAIYHGIKEVRRKGHISVTGRKEGTAVIFEVKDNGIGMDTEQIDDLTHVLNGENVDSERRGYALFNVNDRVRLSFGLEYGLHIESEKSVGTTVILRLPLMEVN